MNAKSLLVAAAIAFVATAALAQVQDELATYACRPSSQVAGEAYGSVVPGTGTTLGRHEVCVEVVAAMRHRSVGHAGN